MPKPLFSVELKGEKELQKAIKTLTQEAIRDLKKETYASGFDIQRKAKENLKDLEAWDTGNLANTIVVKREDQGLTSKIEAQAPYAPYVEYGTRPHFPPMDALEGWARRHGFESAWPICKAISERGLKERPFLLPAYLKVRDVFFKKITEVFRK